MSAESPEPVRPQPRLVLVTGLPGTGKSTVSHFLAASLGAAVLGHDWTMSGLRPFPEVQRALDEMAPSGHRTVGWSVLNALARSQIRHGQSVVLDGVARTPEIEATRTVARSEGARFVLVVTECRDLAIHKSRIVGRERHIPDWYELDWSNVEQSRASWERPHDADLYLNTADSWDDSAVRLNDLLRRDDDAT